MIGQEATQQRQVSLAPLGDPVVVIAVGDRAAHDKQQHLRKRVRNPPRLARVFDDGKMIKKRLQARLFEPFKLGDGHCWRSESRRAHGISQSAIAKPR